LGIVTRVSRHRLLAFGAVALCAFALPAVGKAAGSGASGRAATAVSGPTTAATPVPSLDPAATAKLWRRLVENRGRREARLTAGCRPLRGIFYAPTDWLRLATELAANASPCAQYYISVPPIVADKTKLRPDAAWRIRALGPNFHAMAEIHYATWTKWVVSTGSSWFQAGTTARQRMAAAGYDVTQGDTWVVNEVSSAVRKNTGNARANLRELLRGLYEGDGTHPTRGAAFVIGVGQSSTDLSLYQSNLQNWLSDSDFWTDMNTYVSDWSQEAYGDVRSVAVPGESISTRRDYLNDYLQHELVLANAGPPTIETARGYIRSAYSPLANAAWERQSGYGWTMVPAGQMASYVSAQVYALRYFSATSGETQDHWGFAWAPHNAGDLTPTDFAAQSKTILDRLGAAIRDSGNSESSDPGGSACGPPDQNLYCVGDLPGAHFNDAWKSFRIWTQPVLAFTTPPQTIPAGTPSGPIGIALTNTLGQPFTPKAPVTVTLASSSPQGTFSTSPTGPWSPTLSLTIPAGTSTGAPFYYLDPRAGSPTLIASAPLTTSGTQTETVTPGPAVTLVVSPATATVPARGTRQLSAFGRDSFGNLFPESVTWSLAPQSIGTLSATTGATTTFTALRRPGAATITATLATDTGTLTAGATLRVVPGRLRIAGIVYQPQGRFVWVGIRAIDAAGLAVSRARVSLVVRRNGLRQVQKLVTTGPAGRVSLRIPLRRGGCFTASITHASALGFKWDGRTPRNRFCRRPRSR
jgi:hypothetical protein